MVLGIHISPATCALEDLDEHVDSLLEDVGRGHVDLQASIGLTSRHRGTDLGHADRYWHVER